MKRLAVGVVGLCATAMAQADVYGLVLGRTADIRSEPQLTAEGGLSLEGDLTTFGGQINFKTSPDMMIYGTLAMVDPDAGDSDMAFGGGVVYQFDQQVLPGMDVAFKGSYHLLSYDGSSYGGYNTDFDASDLGFELIISPQEQTVVEGVKVFGMVGFHRHSSEWSASFFKITDSSTEIAFGAGASMPLGAGEAYAALEFVDEMFIGAGYRIALGQ